MTTTTDLLPLTETVAPDDEAGVAEAIRQAADDATPLYPIGGGTALDFGLPAKQPGVGLSTAGINRVVDYPARDMTITVEAGVTMATLAATLATEAQRLPVDAPQADRATLGGLVATAPSGPRRYGHGTMRDYVIGITAVDGRGVPFHGGGRVVKNVAGYDFCKLLTGSLGTLGVITQITLRVKPVPERNALVTCDVSDLDQAEKLLAALVDFESPPAAIELVTGPAWLETSNLLSDNGAPAALVVGLEGTDAEVAWMTARLTDQWHAAGVANVKTLADEQAEPLWGLLTEFPAQRDAPLVIKANIRPGAVVEYVKLVQEIDAECSIQAHAGSGIVIVRFSKIPDDDHGKVLVGRLQPAAARAGGSSIVLSCPGGRLTRQAYWGPRTESVDVMDKIREQFDPQGLFNPGRFVY